MKKFKKMSALILSAAMAVSLIAVPAYADEEISDNAASEAVEAAADEAAEAVEAAADEAAVDMAADEEELLKEEGIEGSCGTNAHYYYENGSLLIYGSGAIKDYSSFDDSACPWNAYRDDIKKVIIDNEITRLGDFCLAALRNVKEIYFPITLTEFGQGCMCSCATNGTAMTLYYAGTKAEFDSIKEDPAHKGWAVYSDFKIEYNWSYPVKDLKYGTWYYDNCMEAHDRGIMSGYGSGAFGPGNVVKRGQLAVILHNVARQPTGCTPESFPDVYSNMWYSDGICWAVSKHVMSGYGNGRFGTEDGVTREQLCTVLYNFANSVMEVPTDDRASLASFTDSSKISSYAVDAMKWCVAKSIISGKKGGTLLDPKGKASRAECASIIVQFLGAYGWQV